MKNPSFFRRTFRSGPAILMVIGLLLIVSLAFADDTTPEGPVPVPCCPENGMRCTGGDDCINGICQKECGNNPFTQGCDCDVSGTGGGDGSVIWIVLIGAVVVIGGAILISRGRQKASTGQKEKEKEKKKPSVYILQLSTDRMTVGPDSPGQLTVTVWKQEPDGHLRQAPEAGISIQVPDGSSGLRVAPATGQGSLVSQVRIEGSIRAGEVMLTVTAGAAGTSESAQVTVVIEQDYVMEFF